MIAGLLATASLISSLAFSKPGVKAAVETKNKNEYRIDGNAVSKETFVAFEKTLTNRKDLVICAETNTGGFSSYEATAPNGARYHVKNESSSGRSISEAIKLPTVP